MTKSEFRQEAGKAGINPNAYGLIVRKSFHTPNGCSKSEVGARIFGITWREAWIRSTRYSPALGNVDDTHLGKEPYVVLKKGRNTYEVEAWRIKGYLSDLFDEMLINMIKEQNAKPSK